MPKYKKNSDDIQIKLPQKTKIDIDMLNYLSANATDYFCKCSYYEKDEEHNIVFDTEGKVSIDSRFYHFSFRECIELLKCLYVVLQFVSDNSLDIKNLNLNRDLIFSDGDKYSFIYLPVKESISGRNSIRKKVIKIIAGFHIREERILNLIKQLNKSPSDEMTLKIIEDFINRYPVEDDYSAKISSPEDEGETTVFRDNLPLDDEGETTIFRDTSSDEDEGETTVFANTSSDEDEGETTVFKSASPDEDEGETVVFQSKDSDTVLPKEDGTEKTEVYDDISSEYETVLFQKSDEHEQYKYEKENPYLVRYINGEIFEIKGSEFKIGKNPENMDMVLNNKSVSRYHAVITHENNTYFIMDNGSTNGTMIEGVMLKPFEKVELGDGSIITLGDEIIQFQLGRR